MAQYKLVTCTINGKKREQIVDVRASLTDMLRNNYHLTSVKKGCEVGECGACTVLIDGEAINSCLYLAVWAEGKNIITLEGLMNPDGTLSDIQTGVHRRDGHPVRLLHAGLHPDGDRDSERGRGVHGRRAAQAPVRAPVPLHRLPEHFPGRQEDDAQKTRQGCRGRAGKVTEAEDRPQTICGRSCTLMRVVICWGKETSRRCGMKKLKESVLFRTGNGNRQYAVLPFSAYSCRLADGSDLPCMGRVSRLLQETRRVKGKQDHKHRVFGVCSRPRLREPVLYVLNIQVSP